MNYKRMSIQNLLSSFILFFHLLAVSGIGAQISINVLGKSISSGVGKIDFTIGQIDYKSYSNSDNKIWEGIHQPFEFQLVSVDNSHSGKKAKLFPNPVSDHLFIWLENDLNHGHFEISDLTGKKIREGSIYHKLTEFNVIEFSEGIYLVKIMDSGITLQFLKFIKTN